MGQVLGNFGGEEKKVNEIGPIIEECYDEFFINTDNWTKADFYHAACQTVEKINTTLGSTQFRMPTAEKLRQVYNTHHQGRGKSLTKEDFQKILQKVIYDSGVTGIGAKDMLLYIFGVPVTTLFIKQRVIPKLIPSEIFIPVVTSITVFALAKFNKI